MVELRKRPPPKEPAVPPPAAKKRGPKPSAKAGGEASSSVTAKAKKAVNKVKEAVVGEDNKDKQPTVETAPPSGEDIPKPTSSDTIGVQSSTVTPVTTTAPASTGGASTVLGYHPSKVPTGTTAGPAISSSKVPTEATKVEDDPNRPQTSEALENPPEVGKIEAATTIAQSAILGGSVGPSIAMPGSSAGGLATVPLSAASVGKLITLEGFGGTVETHAGKKVSVKDLLGEGAAKGGLVIFTYPRASTPGCTQQACLFRDSYTPITSSGLAVYGLSTDSTKANGNFATKQNLPFPLLCDPSASLTGAIGMKKPGSTTRGVVVIDKQGVVKVWFQGGPAKTLDVVMEFIKTM